MTEPDSGKPNLTRQRVILLIFIGLAVLISIGTIFGGLRNYQALYEAGHKDAFGETIDNQAAPPAAPHATPPADGAS